MQNIAHSTFWVLARVVCLRIDNGGLALISLRFTFLLISS